VSPEERAALADLEAWGLVDVLRARYDDEELYTWWDYQAGAFHKHWGMRIDLMLASPTLADRLQWILVDRNARKGQKPSDHAPLIAQFEPAQVGPGLLLREPVAQLGQG
jgi:exodeoxyribonuclease-3